MSCDQKKGCFEGKTCFFVRRVVLGRLEQCLTLFSRATSATIQVCSRLRRRKNESYYTHPIATFVCVYCMVPYLGLVHRWCTNNLA